MKVKKYLTFSNLFLFTSLFILTAGQFVPVEIENGLLRFLVYASILAGLLIVLYKKLKPTFVRLNMYVKILAGVLLSCFVVFYLFISFIFLFFDMCGYSTAKTLYVRKGFSKSTIIVRSYGCGAYDSDMPQYKIVNRIDIFSLIQIVPSIDTSKINKAKWTKIETED